MYLAATFIFIGSTIGAASPEPVATTVSPFCAVVTKVVTLAKAQSAATAFCSSYLTIKPTSTITTTVATVFPTDYPCYASTVQQRDNIEPDLNPDLAKRAIAKPACLATYTAAAQLSSACACLKIPAGTSTVRATATSTDFYISANFNALYAKNRIIETPGRTDSELAFAGTSPAESILWRLATYDPDNPCLLSNGISSGQLMGQAAYQVRDPRRPAQKILYDGLWFQRKDSLWGVACRVAKGTNVLSCQSGLGARNTVDGDTWIIGDGSVGGPLGELTVVPADLGRTPA
jgi:hypothetical protein